MKKTLLAAAMLASFAGVAQAEPSVTLYGVVDTGLGYNKIKGDGYNGSKVGMINGIGSLGAILEGAVTDFVSTRFGWNALFGLFELMALFAAAALLPFVRRRPGLD